MLTDREAVNNFYKIYWGDGCCSDHDRTFVELLWGGECKYSCGRSETQFFNTVRTYCPSTK